MLVIFSYHYVIAQTIAVTSLMALSLFLAIDNDYPFSTHMTLTAAGGLSFDNDKDSYQLLATSRLGFIGCWLVMVKNEPKPYRQPSFRQSSGKQLFIFRDSVSDQDFSRLARVIQQLDKAD
ncbi:hypothetical protein GAB14E_4068 [Colwellia psychrerythraea]|uniref:Uncharacterized protein n=2 Tax=Colwellia psychrerythraea TaxID=28229 RepID=A0A099KGF4_COLPS|nr:hypothetical protein [Colwellia psychrerythraea]KGJ89072.1 hypothetical protein GAB14E_4068 [Colwellia psychrerythraea]